MKSKTSAALMLVAIFGLGAIAGGITQYLVGSHFISNPPPQTRVPNSHDIVEEMAQQLKLNAQQKDKLRGIIQQSREHYRSLSKQFQPQYDKMRAETNDAIRDILTANQRQNFDETLEKMDSRHRDHTHDPRAGGPPPSK
jgi:Spy/CpxP family protein refolding chaperone